MKDRMFGINPTERWLASSFVEEAIRSLATSHGTLPGAAWPGCERWRSGDETKMPLPVASRTVSNKHTATFFQNNTLSSLLFRWREGIVTMKPNLTYAARSR